MKVLEYINSNLTYLDGGTDTNRMLHIGSLSCSRT